MGKKVLYFVAVLLPFSFNSLCEVKAGNKPEMHYSVFWDFYSTNDMGARVWAMGGAGVANVNDVTAMVINPAAFDFDDRFQIYFEVLNKSKNRWMKVIPRSGYYLESRSVLPTFVGFGYNIAERVTTGLGYASPEYYKMDLGEMPLPPPIMEPPLDQTMHPYDKFELRQLVWPIKFEASRCVSLGVNLNYSFLSLDQWGYYTNDPQDWRTKIPITKVSDVHFLSFKLGALVGISQLLNLQAGNVSLGMTYTPQESFRPKVEWRSSMYYWEESFGETILPRRLELGMRISDLSFPLNFAGDVKFHDNSEIEDLVDRWDIHLGCEWESTDNLAFQFGYFARLDYRDPDVGWLDEVGEYDQHFLTAGVRISLYDYLLQFSIRDSHLLSSGLIETTQMSVGGGVGF